MDCYSFYLNRCRRRAAESLTFFRLGFLHEVLISAWQQVLNYWRWCFEVFETIKMNQLREDREFTFLHDAIIVDRL